MSKSIHYNKTRGTSYLISIATGIKEEVIERSISHFSYNLNKFKRASCQELKASGLNSRQSEKLLAYFESISCFTGFIAEENPALNTPSDVYRALAQDMAGLTKETFKILLVDTKNHLIAIKTVSIGILDASLVHCREVFKEAILENCSSIILSHNHPSGVVTPSAQDLEITRNLISAGKIMGIEIIDHVIVGNSGKFLSMKEKRLI